MTRKYVMNRRTERLEGTRQRIVEAAVELHGTLGPAQTTFSALAKRAGVQRHTLYSHFPEPELLFQACRAHFLATNPPPSPTAWRLFDEPGERSRCGLSELYAYYTAHKDIIWNVLRDSNRVPVGEGFHQLHQQAANVLAEAWTRPNPRLRAVAYLATDFLAWRSLANDSGLSPEATVDLMVSLMGSVSSRPL